MADTTDTWVHEGAGPEETYIVTVSRPTILCDFGPVPTNEVVQSGERIIGPCESTEVSVTVRNSRSSGAGVVIDNVDFTVQGSERCLVASTACEALKGLLRWNLDNAPAGTAYSVQESINRGSWRPMRALADTTALLADSLAAYSYVRDTKSTADNYAGSYLIRRGRPDTNHRFRVRGNPSGAWVETDIGTPVALPAPVTPSTPGLLSQNNCRHAYASCSPPGQPEADLIYSGNRISVEACPMKFDQSQNSWNGGWVLLGGSGFSDCTGRRTGSTSFTASYSGDTEAWEVKFKARARNSNRGSNFQSGFAMAIGSVSR